MNLLCVSVRRDETFGVTHIRVLKVSGRVPRVFLGSYRAQCWQVLGWQVFGRQVFGGHEMFGCACQGRAVVEGCR